ncbi:unnamed protein product [Pieris macdunnoughi]|uniref:Uncharacterized protein n=1 Tax=Pieris macdunnoughi TaxID=345717 RepID=A0A821SVZ6_9NEOP|nr:unnamed protein product [Pieris macdunnoughi]
MRISTEVRGGARSLCVAMVRDQATCTQPMATARAPSTRVGRLPACADTLWARDADGRPEQRRDRLLVINLTLATCPITISFAS